MDAASPALLQTRPRRVVVARCAGRLLAVDQEVVSTVASLTCSPPPPGSAPWVDGLADHEGRLALVMAPFGTQAGDEARRPVLALLLTGAEQPAIAMRIDGNAGFGDAAPRPATERLSAACPASWLRPCRLDDGRDAVLIDTQAVRSAWAAA